ncbi:hypothetical protein BC828DRAFT_383469 [Blastocladiella britannica]|nr:hypothetical protein BC828DRAFT_383469 [Blastocladiella britannica]
MITINWTTTLAPAGSRVLPAAAGLAVYESVRWVRGYFGLWGLAQYTGLDLRILA